MPVPIFESIGSGGTIASSIGLTMPAGAVWTFEPQTLTTATNVSSNAAPPQITATKSEFLKNDLAGAGTPYTVTTTVGGYSGERINWDTPLSNGLGLTITAGVIQFASNDRVSLKCSIHPRHTTGLGAMFSLVEIAGGVPTILQSQPAGQAVSSTSAPLPSGTIVWTFDPDPAKFYAIEFLGGWGSNAYNSGSRLNWLQIEKTGTVATSGNLPAVAAIQGQWILADRTTDSGNWILGDGRLISTLTPAQQAVAIALGYTTNIPDMRGRVPVGAGGTLAATLGGTGGSLTIARNQLPNFDITHTISSTFNCYQSTATPAWDNNVLNGTTNFAMTQSTPEVVNANLQGAGILSISANAFPLNGNVTQQNFMVPYRASNWFIWLGPIGATVTFAPSSIQLLNATGTVLAWNSIVELGNTPLTANSVVTLPPCSPDDIGKTIRFTRRDSAAFTVTLAANGSNTLELSTTTALNTQYGAIEIVCSSATVAKQIGPIAGTGTAAKPSLPAVGAITKGRPLQWFNNGGVASVRDCLQGTAGLSTPISNAISNLNANADSTFVPGNFNAGFRADVDGNTFGISKWTLAANGTVSAAVGNTTTLPSAGLLLIQGVHALGTFGNESTALFLLSDNSSQGYAIGAGNLSGTPALSATINTIPTSSSRTALCPMSISGAFWVMSNGGSLYRVDVNGSTGATTVNAGVAGFLSGWSVSGTGQSMAMYYTPSTPGTSDNIFVVGQEVGDGVKIINYGRAVTNATGGTGAVRTIAARNPGVGAMQTLPCALSGGTSNFISVNTFGQLQMFFVDCNTAGVAAQLGSNFTIPSFPASPNAVYIQIAPKNYNLNNVSATFASPTSTTGSAIPKWSVRYTPPNSTTTYYATVRYNFSTNTFTEELTLTTSHPESVNQTVSSLPGSIIGTLTDPASFFRLGVAGTGTDRIQNVVAGSFSVSTDIIGIADATVASGVACPFNPTGSVITGLSGLTPGQRSYLDPVSGSLVTTDTGAPVYRALDATTAIVNVKFQ